MPSSPVPSALTMIRVARGAPPPDEAALQAAIARDRATLQLSPNTFSWTLGVAGPYAIVVDGQELDEYVVWER